MLRTLRSLSAAAVRSSLFSSNPNKPNFPSVTILLNANSFHSSPCNWQVRQQAIKANVKDVLKVAKDCHSQVYLIDVREPDEIQETGSIPNSINIPLQDIQKAFQCMSEEEFLRRYRKAKPLYRSDIIFYCKTGNRSSKAQATVLGMGYRYAANYLGGWEEWSGLQKKKK